jgi:hypothetical protein
MTGKAFACLVVLGLSPLFGCGPAHFLKIDAPQDPERGVIIGRIEVRFASPDGTVNRSYFGDGAKGSILERGRIHVLVRPVGEQVPFHVMMGAGEFDNYAGDYPSQYEARGTEGRKEFASFFLGSLREGHLLLQLEPAKWEIVILLQGWSTGGVASQVHTLMLPIKWRDFEVKGGAVTCLGDIVVTIASDVINASIEEKKLAQLDFGADFDKVSVKCGDSRCIQGKIDVKVTDRCQAMRAKLGKVLYKAGLDTKALSVQLVQ